MWVDPPLEFERVKVLKDSPISEISQRCQVSTKEIAYYNPALTDRVISGKSRVPPPPRRSARPSRSRTPEVEHEARHRHHPRTPHGRDPARGAAAVRVPPGLSAARAAAASARAPSIAASSALTRPSQASFNSAADGSPKRYRPKKVMKT